ncbi:MAG: hypothetical protein IKN59_05700 [Paludibacteraceae bacterium]|nr:hypothetical protein [Paludibacteraceae bacterium]
MDFTLNTYKELLTTLRQTGYEFVTVEQLSSSPQQERSEGSSGLCALRHDVDARLEASVAMAQTEADMGIRSSYYFRSREIYHAEKAIRMIAAMGHEIGYHYEDLSLMDGNAERAWEHFKQELAWLRQSYPVRTVCMHGAPRSRYDGRDLWKTYDYKQEGILCEPYIDLDYSRLLYLTDTGRRWDGYRMSVRDKIPAYQEEWKKKGWAFHTTDDIIRAAEERRLPATMLISTHPQRWVVGCCRWLTEWLTQAVKNEVKKRIVKYNI